MAKKTTPQGTQSSADSRIYTRGLHRGYSLGYDAGHTDGLKEGTEAFQKWLTQDLRTLAQDVSLKLRHDVSGPLDVLAAVTALIAGGPPVVQKDDDDA